MSPPGTSPRSRAQRVNAFLYTKEGNGPAGQGLDCADKPPTSVLQQALQWGCPVRLLSACLSKVTWQASLGSPAPQGAKYASLRFLGPSTEKHIRSPLWLDHVPAKVWPVLPGLVSWGLGCGGRR